MTMYLYNLKIISCVGMIGNLNTPSILTNLLFSPHARKAGPYPDLLQKILTGFILSNISYSEEIDCTREESTVHTEEYLIPNMSYTG